MSAGLGCAEPERPLPAQVPGRGLRVARWPRGNLTKKSETQANLPGRDKVEGLEAEPTPPPEGAECQRELNPRGDPPPRPRSKCWGTSAMRADTRFSWQVELGLRTPHFPRSPFPRAPLGPARPPAAAPQPSSQQLKRFQNGLFVCSQ